MNEDGSSEDKGKKWKTSGQLFYWVLNVASFLSVVSYAKGFVSDIVFLIIPTIVLFLDIIVEAIRWFRL